MIGVVDTSAVVRLFIPDGEIPEGLEEFIRKAERGENVLIAPELVLAEIGNVLHRKNREGVITSAERDQLVADCLDLPIRLCSHRDIFASSVEIAGEHGLTVYDALFLALAIRQGARLFTADERLHKVADSLGL